MKKLLLLVLLILIGCSKEPINMDEMLIDRNDVYYTKDTNKPYSGPVFSLYPNGKLKIEKTLKDGKEDGPWKSYHSNGQLQQETTFKDGYKDGPFKSYHDNGQLRKEGTYKDGELIDVMTFQYYLDKNGESKLKITYKNDEPWNGVFSTSTLDSENFYVSTYKNGILDGDYKSYLNGKLFEKGTYKNNVEVGSWKLYDDNIIYETIYNNKGENLDLITFENGKPRNGLYIDYYDWTPNKYKSIYGTTIVDQEFEEKRFRRKFPKVRTESNYKDGRMDGIYKSYSNDSYFTTTELSYYRYKLNIEGNLEPYGPLEEEGTFKDGKLDGIWKYYENGQLKKEETYEDGELIESKVY